MPKVCAVRTCHTGCRTSNNNFSTFRVPRDDEQFRKWLAVIPGLKQSQFVYEKHFEKRFVLREWQKEDADGRIIAQVLQRSLQLLNDWESSMRQGDITADEFLTPTTARGLRISLQSTMDLCKYLIETFDFQYLLTGKVNQDNLEKFFGTIRQAAGCNDHPSCPTFLQLYKLLSIYSVIKPPKFGNCTVSEEKSSILILLHDLKSIYGEKSESKFATCRLAIKKKLDDSLRHDNWEADDVIEYDHDYALAPVLDCIIYYVTGYLCKQVLKSYNACKICVRVVRSESPCRSSMSQLVDEKSRGGLIHASSRFYKLIRNLEACFAKHASRKDVFDCTVGEFMTAYDFTFPCQEHASDILSYAIVYYIRLRMRQNTQQENAKRKKKNSLSKKSFLN